MSKIVDVTGTEVTAPVTKLKDFRCQFKLSYSDDTGKATEQSVLFGTGTTYQEFITMCQKAYEVIAHTYGDGFEEATKAENKIIHV